MFNTCNRFMRYVLIAAALLLAFGSHNNSSAQQPGGELAGRVIDQLGAVVVGATVTVVDESGGERNATTDGGGNYLLKNIKPGRYLVRVFAEHFSLTEQPDVEISGGKRAKLDLTLTVTLEAQSVVVSTEAPLNVASDHNRNALRLGRKQLDALPDDPDDLAASLRALAGPSAGMSGSEIYVDGFSSNVTVPSKESIKEVRLNENPFSAEYDKLGFGRIEIITKAGTNKFSGQTFFNFSDESLNARNPFAANRAPFQSRYFGGSLSGPIVANKLSFFFDADHRSVIDNAVVNGFVLDNAFNVAPLERAVLVPQSRTYLAPRLDYQVNPSNSLIVRYSFLRQRIQDTGVGEFNLPSRGIDANISQHAFQVTETSVLNAVAVNETRFQFFSNRLEQSGNSSTPTIRVLDAFTGGGAPFGLAFNNSDSWELHNNTTISRAAHVIKFGARLRGIKLKESLPQNYNGTYTFVGGTAPALDANYQPIIDPTTGLPVSTQITSIERYSRTQALLARNATAAQIRALGGGATQFSIVSGNPLARVSQFDAGLYVLDDWQVRPGLSLGLGLRYERQTNIESNLNFAPRFSFAWAPGQVAVDSDPKTVIRGGFGIFYDRVGEGLQLQARHDNGTAQQQLITSDPALLGAYPFLPTLSVGDPSLQTIRRIAPDISAPYSMQWGASLERQLPFNTTLAVSYVNTRTLHVLRSRNINAPLPGTYLNGNPQSGIRPFGNIGNIYEYESGGTFKQSQLVFNLFTELNSGLSLFGSYILNNARSNTDGAESFPADSYDLSGEFGRAFLDSRHRFIGGGSIPAPWKLNFSPLIIASSGRPFNIITGVDTNGDTMFTERPAFATDLNKPGVIVTKFGAFDPNPLPGQQLIPRNYGQGPAFVLVMLRVGRTFEFGDMPQSASGGSGQEKRFKLSFSLQVMNLLNHTNAGTVIGNLSSPLFGNSNATSKGSFSDGSAAGSFNSRRVEAQIRLRF